MHVLEESAFFSSVRALLHMTSETAGPSRKVYIQMERFELTRKQQNLRV